MAAGTYDRLLTWQRHAYGPDPADGFGSAADALTALGRVWGRFESAAANPEQRRGGDELVRRVTLRTRGRRPLAPLDRLTDRDDGTVWEVESCHPDPDARETVAELVSPPTRPDPPA